MSVSPIDSPESISGTVFQGGNQPDITTGLMNLYSVTQMIFCIAQDDSSAQELDAYTLLGISNILQNAGNEIECAYNELFFKEEVGVKRHMKLRVNLASYLESESIVCKSAIASILADDENRED